MFSREAPGTGDVSGGGRGGRNGSRQPLGLSLSMVPSVHMKPSAAVHRALCRSWGDGLRVEWPRASCCRFTGSGGRLHPAHTCAVIWMFGPQARPQGSEGKGSCPKQWGPGRGWARFPGPGSSTVLVPFAYKHYPKKLLQRSPNLTASFLTFL